MAVQDLWKRFLSQCLECKTEKDLNDFFDLILTYSEREELPKRLAILDALFKGEKTQREIAKDLNVGIANVTRASNVIKQQGFEIQKILGEKDESQQN